MTEPEMDLANEVSVAAAQADAWDQRAPHFHRLPDDELEEARAALAELAGRLEPLLHRAQRERPDDRRLIGAAGFALRRALNGEAYLAHLLHMRRPASDIDELTRPTG